VVSLCGVSAAGASASPRVANVGVAVALASLAIREAPESWLTLVALPAVRVGPALALSALHVAKVVERADRVAVASFKNQV